MTRQPLEIYLNHNRLRDLSPKILINGITENQPTYDTTTGERPGFWGERILADDRTELTISVEIILRELYDRTLRGQLVEQIGSWMRSTDAGWLLVNVTIPASILPSGGIG